MPPSVLDEPATTQGLRHAPTTIALHWITAVLVVLLFIIGKTIDDAPRGPLRVDYRSLHMLLGVTLGLVLIVRVAWRTTRGGMLPALHQGLLLLIARATHYLLYALMVVTVCLGITNVWVQGELDFQPGESAATGPRRPRAGPPDRRLACAVRRRGGDRRRAAQRRRAVPPFRHARRHPAPHAAVGRALTAA